MNNYSIAANSDGRIEAFFIVNGTVMHTWQKQSNNELDWSTPLALGGNPTGPSLPSTPVEVECCNDLQGQIHVIVVTSNGNIYTCYQTPGAWNGWFQITQS